MEQDVLKVIRRFIEQGIAKQDQLAFDECMADTVIEHQPGMPQDRAGIRAELWKIKSYFPDVSFSFQQSAVNGDTVWAHYLVSGTHSGNPLMGHPPNGKAFKMDLMDIAKIKDGKIIEHWGIADRLDMLRQLGYLG
jgi:predicted ester cyclase